MHLNWDYEDRTLESSIPGTNNIHANNIYEVYYKNKTKQMIQKKVEHYSTLTK
jgi:hypothetical protein